MSAPNSINRRQFLRTVGSFAFGVSASASIFYADRNKDGIVNFQDHDQRGGIGRVVELSRNWLNTYKVIRTAEDLQNIRTDLNAEYVLANDIDLTDFDFHPIGTADNPFTGTLIGNGYSINNLTLDRGSEDNVGLFRFLDGAKILDLGIKNVDIVGRTTVGTVAGEVKDAILYKIATSGTVEARNSDGGGLVGKILKGVIEDSYSNCDLKGDQSLGGIIGYGYGSDPDHIVISKCYSTGNIDGFLMSNGGIVGQASKLIVTDCYSTGTVGGLIPEYIGGIVGENQGNTEVHNSYYTNLVNGSGLGTPEPLGVDAFKGLDHSHPVYGTVETPIWDFEKVWEAHADSLPTLRRNPQPTPPQP